MHGEVPGWVTIGEPLIFGTLGRDAAFGLPGLTAPGMPGWVIDGAVPLFGRPEPKPVVPDGPGFAGAMPGAGAPPGWVGAVPIPLGEPPTCAWAEPASSAANPAARTNLDRGAMVSSSPGVFRSLPNGAGRPLFPKLRQCPSAHCFVLGRRSPTGVSMNQQGGEAADIEYAYKASLMGGAWILRLAPDALHWSVGAMSGVVPYPSIRRIRLSYRPVTMQSYRFLAEIWAEKSPKIPIASASWKSLMEQERQDEAYSRFIRALHERIAAAGGRPELKAGALPLLYWPGTAVFGGLCFMGASLAVRSMDLGESALGQPTDWTQKAAILALVAMFFWLIWQMGSFFKRNLPRRYTLDAIPPDVLPKPAA